MFQYLPFVFLSRIHLAILKKLISHVLNEQGTGNGHIFSLVRISDIEKIEKWGTSSEKASKTQ